MVEPKNHDMDNLVTYIEKGKNRNTERKIRIGGLRFTNFLKSNGVTSSLTDISKETMNVHLGNYILNFKNAVTGEDVEPDTLSSAFRVINEYIKRDGCDYDLLRDPAFEIARKVLATRRNELMAKGKGNKPQKAQPLTKEQENRLFLSGQMGLHSPQALVNFLWYGMVKGFGMRGCHECKQLMWGDVTLIEDEDRSYLEWNERLTKTRTGTGRHYRAFVPKIFANVGNPKRCLVEAFKLFQQKRPKETLAPNWKFFLQIKHSASSSSPIWFKCQPLGVHSLESIMKKMANNIGMTGRYTNHSARSSSINQLIHAGVAPQLVAQASGHKDVSSVMSYAVANREQQIGMSDILLTSEEGPQLVREPLAKIPLPPTAALGRSPSAARRPPSAALGRPPTPVEGLENVAEASDDVITLTQTAISNEGVCSSVLTKEPAQKDTRSNTLDRLHGMFSGAIIYGNINITLK